MSERVVCLLDQSIENPFKRLKVVNDSAVALYESIFERFTRLTYQGNSISFAGDSEKIFNFAGFDLIVATQILGGALFSFDEIGKGLYVDSHMIPIDFLNVFKEYHFAIYYLYENRDYIIDRLTDVLLYDKHYNECECVKMDRIANTLHWVNCLRTPNRIAIGNIEFLVSSKTAFTPNLNK